VRAFKHSRSGKIFTPRRNPSEVVSPAETYTAKRAAGVLGTEPETVKDLVDRGHINARNSDTIRGDDLADFASKLKPVEVEVVEKLATNTPPKGAVKAAPTGKPAPKAPSKPAADEDDPDLFEAECPRCSEQLTIAGDVDRARCPGCKTVLTIARPISADDQDEADEGDESDDEETERNPFLGIFGHGRRGR